MNYREDKYGNRLSALGFGCMRFQRKAGRIDLEEAERQIMLAYHAGVNYYDTAYIYPGSEAAIGEIFEKNGIRDKLYIATKLPHYLIKNMQVLEKLFSEQLQIFLYPQHSLIRYSSRKHRSYNKSSSYRCPCLIHPTRSVHDASAPSAY